MLLRGDKMVRGLDLRCKRPEQCGYGRPQCAIILLALRNDESRRPAARIKQRSVLGRAGTTVVMQQSRLLFGPMT
jgi:hypothetical protein